MQTQSESGEIVGSTVADILDLRVRPFLPPQNPLPFFVHVSPLQAFERFEFFEGLRLASELYSIPLSILQIDKGYEAPQDTISALALEWVEKNDFAGEASDSSLDSPEDYKTELFFQSSYRVRQFEDLLIPFISSYLDQGQALWPAPWRNQTLCVAFLSYLKFHPLRKKISFQLPKDLWQEITDLTAANCANLDQWSSYWLYLLFKLKGWSGILQAFELSSEFKPVGFKANLAEWLYILLKVDKALGASRPLTKKKKIIKFESVRFIKTKEWESIFATKKLFNLANPPQEESKVQVFFCMDDREEGLRRHVEQINPNLSTFGIPGHYYLAMSFKKAGSQILTKQCPPPVSPIFAMQEEEIKPSAPPSEALSPFLRVLEQISSSLGLALLSLFGRFLKILNPPLVTRMRRFLSSPIPKETRLREVEMAGVSLAQKIEATWSVLALCGWRPSQSKLLIFLGHQSTTSNNPFNQAYGCGACSGNSARPNVRVILNWANDKDVRLGLEKKGLRLPDSLTVVGGVHDTCTDTIQWLKPEGDYPFSSEQIQIWETIKADFETALARNASERLPIFPDSDDSTYEAARELVEERAYDLAQPRPEYGHTNVASAVMGPRTLTRGAGFNRQSFLISYDCRHDKDGSSLLTILQNTLPVCLNISMDYFCSAIAPQHFGAGSKLPVNVTGLLGIMSGSKSDLRVGLPLQTTDRHNCRRLTFWVEAHWEHLERALLRMDRIHQGVQNAWLKLIWIEPESGKMFWIKKLAPLEKIELPK